MQLESELAIRDAPSQRSGIPELRASLRNEDTLRGFQDIVKNEDKLHSFNLQLTCLLQVGRTAEKKKKRRRRRKI